MRGPSGPSLADVARLLPDHPSWVEVRGMLLAGRARLLGPVGTAPPTFVALHAGGDVAVVVGRAGGPAIAAAAGVAREILAVPEDSAWVAGFLPGWAAESATLLRRPAGSPLPAPPSGFVRLLGEGEVASIADLPAPLRRELRRECAAGTPVAAALEGATPVAFCYAGSITEGLWDVSIDTLEAYRRRGHAQRAARFLIEHYAARGKEPVWGAMLSNHASAALAGRLGFVPVGSLTVFAAPETGSTSGSPSRSGFGRDVQPPEETM